MAAVPALRALAETADVALVVTRPDRRRGRSGRKAPSDVR
ncbi:MAG: methionyl-tRNA formyltransferase, partial [Acidimicrobiia bacterium]|nr:methionyl-tRNA formyltransferase [Acidimicrobiia bacterium]